MIFSSNLFLFAVLPAIVITYHLCPVSFRNVFLFVVSLLIYFWSCGPAVILLVACVVFNYFAGKLMTRCSDAKAGLVFGIAITSNLLLLVYYKYGSFLCAQISTALHFIVIDWNPYLKVTLPLGISFFTFKAISYQFEVYRQVTPPAASFVNFGTYLTMFPQIAAGPIARYSETRQELQSRCTSIDLVFDGIQRFSFGLGKKVLIANSLGSVVDKIFNMGSGELTTPHAWLGAICFSFQIYYDFSGYTDMAIGMGNFLGFRFPENFNQPYRAQNITEFWRRWHMTLSFWFRDFLFLPMEYTMAHWWQNTDGKTGRFRQAWTARWNGIRGPAYRTCLSFVVVFSLCGLWHGAAWTFITWGVYHGFLLATELVIKRKFKWQSSGVTGTTLTFFLLTLGWVLFRADSLKKSWGYLQTLFGFHTVGSTFNYFPLRYYLQNDVIFYLAVAAIFAWLPVEKFNRIFKDDRPLQVFCRGGAALLMLTYSAIVLSTAGFNPFIYFRF